MWWQWQSLAERRARRPPCPILHPTDAGHHSQVAQARCPLPSPQLTLCPAPTGACAGPPALPAAHTRPAALPAAMEHQLSTSALAKLSKDLKDLQANAIDGVKARTGAGWCRDGRPLPPCPPQPPPPLPPAPPPLPAGPLGMLTIDLRAPPRRPAGDPQRRQHRRHPGGVCGARCGAGAAMLVWVCCVTPVGWPGCCSGLPTAAAHLPCHRRRVHDRMRRQRVPAVRFLSSRAAAPGPPAAAPCPRCAPCSRHAL